MFIRNENYFYNLYKKTLLNNDITHTCDKCNKKSSFANRTCNICFIKLVGIN